jgi:hypothetical protein
VYKANYYVPLLIISPFHTEFSSGSFSLNKNDKQKSASPTSVSRIATMRGQFCAELRSPIGKAVIIGGHKGNQQGRRGGGWKERSEEAEHYGTSSNGHNCFGRIILHADHCREFVKIKLHFKLEYPLNLVISAEQNTGK